MRKSKAGKSHSSVLPPLSSIVTTLILCIFAHNLQPTTHDQILAEVLFATPLARTHLRTRTNTTHLNARLLSSILHDHTTFRASHKTSEDLNNAFFEHQVSNATSTYRALPEYRLVSQAVGTVVTRLLSRMGYTEKPKLQSWATVHVNGSSHEAHTHDGALLAAVYYVRVPEDAGVLRLYDPRNGEAYTGAVELRPMEGEIVAFPAWLLHEVAGGEGLRVSIAFNILGKGEVGAFAVERTGLGRWKKRRKAPKQHEEL